MNLAAELEAAATWLGNRVDRLPADKRPDTEALWDQLAEALEDSRSHGSATLAILLWRQDVARLLDGKRS